MRYLYLCFFSLVSFLSFGQAFNGKQKFIDPGTRIIFSKMGQTVALTDNFAFVGAPQSPLDTANANPIGNAGLVLVYKKNAFGGWDFHQKLQSSNRNNLAQFAWSMAVQDSLLVVGARGEYVGFPNNGAAHVFKLQNGYWVHQQRLISNDTALGARFGCSVAIDGNTIVVGAERNPTDSLNQSVAGSYGAAYIFENQNGAWTLSEKLSSGVLSVNNFGTEVAVQGDEVFVSAPNEWLTPTGQQLGYYGALYRFKKNTQGQWNQNLHLTDTMFRGGGTVGATIAWQDSNLIISNLEYSFDTIISGGAVFHLNLNKLNSDPLEQIITVPFPLDNDNFGHDLVLDWPNLFVGVPNEDHDANQQNPMASAGGVYWYQFNAAADSFQLQQIILPQDRNVPLSTFDSFGFGIAFHNGGLLVGAPNDDEDTLNLNPVNGAGSAYFLDSLCNVISSIARDTLCFGDSLLFAGQTLGSSGNYQGLFTAANGCDSLVSLDLIVRSLNRDSLSVNACDSYQLPSGVLVQQSGLYYDTLSSFQACDSIIITNLILDSLNTQVAITITGGVAMAMDTNATYQWFDCDLQQILVGETNRSLITPYPGNFAVILNKGACTDTSECFFLSDMNLEAYHGARLEVYPNPSSSKVYFSQYVKEAKLFSLEGRFIENVEGRELDLSPLSPGLYHLNTQQGQILILKTN